MVLLIKTISMESVFGRLHSKPWSLRCLLTVHPQAKEEANWSPTYFEKQRPDGKPKAFHVEKKVGLGIYCETTSEAAYFKTQPF